MERIFKMKEISGIVLGIKNITRHLTALEILRTDTGEFSEELIYSKLDEDIFGSQITISSFEEEFYGVKKFNQKISGYDFKYECKIFSDAKNRLIKYYENKKRKN